MVDNATLFFLSSNWYWIGLIGLWKRYLYYNNNVLRWKELFEYYFCERTILLHRRGHMTYSSESILLTNAFDVEQRSNSKKLIGGRMRMRWGEDNRFNANTAYKKCKFHHNILKHFPLSSHLISIIHRPTHKSHIFHKYHRK